MLSGFDYGRLWICTVSLAVLAMPPVAGGARPARARSAQPAGKPVVCVDPGHPSEINDGLQRVNGTTETAVNWQVAERLRDKLQADGLTVVMTKSHELQHVNNRARADIANAAHVALMIRLHADSGAGSGFRVFYPDRSGRHEGVTGPPAGVREASRQAALAVHAALAFGLRGELHDNGVAGEIHTRVGKRFGALIGSIHSKVPTVLVEMVFLSSRGDAEFIKSARGQVLMASALAKGVENFVAEPHVGAAPTGRSK